MLVNKSYLIKCKENDLIKRNTPTFISSGWKLVAAGAWSSLGIKENGEFKKLKAYKKMIHL